MFEKWGKVGYNVIATTGRSYLRAEKDAGMFIGTYHNSIDSKNRMIVPSKLRDDLGGKCILTTGLDKCLYIYSLEDWTAQMEKLAGLPDSDEEVRSFIRRFSGNAAECEFDKAGRIVIPGLLKAYAEIDKNLVTVGAIKKIEVWAEEVYESVAGEEKMKGVSFDKALGSYSY